MIPLQRSWTDGEGVVPPAFWFTLHPAYSQSAWQCSFVNFSSTHHSRNRQTLPLKKYCVLPLLDHCHTQPDVSREREGTMWSPGVAKGNSITSNWVDLPHLLFLSFCLYIILNTNHLSLSKSRYGYNVYLYKCYMYEKGFYSCWERFKPSQSPWKHQWHSYSGSWCRRNYLNPGVGHYNGQTK